MLRDAIRKNSSWDTPANGYQRQPGYLFCRRRPAKSSWDAPETKCRKQAGTCELDGSMSDALQRTHKGSTPNEVSAWYLKPKRLCTTYEMEMQAVQKTPESRGPARKQHRTHRVASIVRSPSPNFQNKKKKKNSPFPSLLPLFSLFSPSAPPCKNPEPS